MKISFDHCYQKIMSAEPYLALGERGFTVKAEPVEHPGKLMCRFLKFNHPHAPASALGCHYLEFIEVTDLAALKAGYAASIADRRPLEPGVSLRCDRDLKQLYTKLKTALASCVPGFDHRNYNWKEDSTSALPGWNFLTFDEPLVRDMYIWCTEYEPVPDRIPPSVVYTHPNTVERFHGFVWNLPMAELAPFQELTRSEQREGRLELNDGLTVYSAEAPGLPPEVLDATKTYAFAAAVLVCSDWATFVHAARPDKVFAWGDKQAGLIQMPETGWNIVVVDR